MELVFTTISAAPTLGVTSRMSLTSTVGACADLDVTNPNNPDDNFPTTMVEPIADKSGGHYSQSITLPTTPCENCTLQLIQVMTTSVPYNSFYFQCADIRITGAAVPG